VLNDIDSKVLATLIAAIISIIGVFINFFLIRLEKKRIQKSLDIDQERLTWDKQKFGAEKDIGVKHEGKSDLFKDKILAYREVFSIISLINHSFRELFRILSKSSGNPDEDKILIGKAMADIEDLMKRLIKINIDKNIYFSLDSHKLIGDYWLPNSSSLQSSLKAIIEDARLPLSDKAVHEANYLIRESISLNRDLKDELVKELD